MAKNSLAPRPTPAKDQRNPIQRLRAVIIVLDGKTKELAIIGGSFCGLGTMTLPIREDYAPWTVLLFSIGLLFALWWFLKILSAGTNTKKQLISLYAITAMLLTSSVSWYISTPAISKTVLLEAWTIHGQDKPRLCNLSGNLYWRHILPPVMRVPFDATTPQRIFFTVNHGEVGSMTTGQLWIYPCKGIEFVKMAGQEQAVGFQNQIIHYITRFYAVPHSELPAPLFPHFELKSEKPGWYPIRYEIRNATITNTNKPTGTIKGRFILRFY